MTVFRGTGLPDAYRGGAFSCDPTGNLVHFDRLEPRGATFSARPVGDGVEFLASRDNWFRPVFLAHGPDGALYVCDMYRKTIEHPDYLPVEIRKRTDFESGKDDGPDLAGRPRRRDGRRARAPPPASTSPRPRPRSSATLLRDPDGWWRDTAHRLLLERRDRAVDRAAPVARGRSRRRRPRRSSTRSGCWRRSAASTDDLLRRALDHPAAPVREHALQLVEPRLAGDPGWLAAVLPLRRRRGRPRPVPGGDRPGRRPGARATDGASPPRWPGSRPATARDRWARAAVFSSLAGREAAFLAALRDRPRTPARWPPELLDELGRLLGASRPRGDWPGSIRIVVDGPPGFAPEEQAALLTGFAEAARGRLEPASSGDVLAAAIGPGAAIGDLPESVGELVARHGAAALDPRGRSSARRPAVGLLGVRRLRPGRRRRCSALVDPEQPAALQVGGRAGPGDRSATTGSRRRCWTRSGSRRTRRRSATRSCRP